jgi:hypothetical protein
MTPPSPAGRSSVRRGIAQVGEPLDGLVRRPVLAERQAVVREDVDDVQAHQGSQPARAGKTREIQHPSRAILAYA